MTRPTESAEVREQIARALRLDLIGPWAGHALADERLRGWERPSNWYLTGFLVPRGAPVEQRGDADVDDEPEVAERAGLGDDSTEDRRAAKKGFFPSSMGLSFLVSEGVDALEVLVRWGDYRRVEAESGDPNRDRTEQGGEAEAERDQRETPADQRAGESEDGAGGEGRDEEQADAGPDGTSQSQVRSWWQRTPREESVPVTLPATTGDPRPHPVPNSGGLILHAVARPVDAASFAGRIAPGTRSVSLFLVNDRIASSDRERDEAFAFQAEIEVRSAAPFVPRPDPREVSGDDWDERVADLHYARTPEYAVGHGVSADWELVDGACRILRTTWTPAAEVEKTDTFDPPGAVLDMQALGALADGSEVEAALMPLVTGYRSWLEDQHASLGGLTGERREAAEQLVRIAGIAASRMERGIRVLVDDADALDAFRTANRAVAAALSRRLAREGNTGTPRWRAFQLAFILLNLPGIADPADPEREFVDLLFFPTGGGKTEAYLGLAAFTMVLRRLRNPGENGRAGAGVSVIMRYTLRLLTLDQLGRAAGLICALELERRGDAAGRLGEWPFEIGLWVGKAGTPNHLGEKGDGRSDSARAKVSQYKNNPRGRPTPIPMENCPWCGEDFTPHSFALLPNAVKPTDLRIACANWQCEFSGDHPLPIVAVDELRELGGARRILEEEVQNTLKRYSDRRRLGEAEGLFRDRSSFSDVVELTSRVGTDKVAEARKRLGCTFHDRRQRVDCAIATNMISVGLDIQRLGLMLVYGQPKTHSEYIQATSRVGRDDRRPGLVVTLYNVHKPRDRSHYERFRHYHETFYRSVEVSSVTPFAARALDRGFAGALVALARHARPTMTPPDGVGGIETERAALERLLLDVFGSRIHEQPFADDTERAERLRSVQNRVGDLFDSWRAIYDEYRRDGVPMQYQKYEVSTRKPLLREMLDTDFESHHHKKFRTNRSLRDVEPQVNLFLKDLSSRLGGGGGA